MFADTCCIRDNLSLAMMNQNILKINEIIRELMDYTIKQNDVVAKALKKCSRE
jgi:hypothetical protein